MFNVSIENVRTSIVPSEHAQIYRATTKGKQNQHEEEYRGAGGYVAYEKHSHKREGDTSQYSRARSKPEVREERMAKKPTNRQIVRNKPGYVAA